MIVELQGLLPAALSVTSVDGLFDGKAIGKLRFAGDPARRLGES